MYKKDKPHFSFISLKWGHQGYIRIKGFIYLIYSLNLETSACSSPAILARFSLALVISFIEFV